ncbi:hypothetical protein V6N13_036476 [Hibiscus sabdariffa]
MSTHHDCLDDLDKNATKIMSKLAVPRKISIFGWRMFHNLLPTRFNLLMRGINLDATCKLCREDVEDDTHIFWSCSCVTTVFADSCFSFLRQQHHKSCKGIIQNLISYGNLDMLQEYLVMCWRVWGMRNSFYQTGTAPDFSSVRNWCTEYIHQSRTTNQQRFTGFGQCLLVTKWERPPHGFCKLNVGAGRGKCGKTMGFGAVLRDANGSFIAARSWKQAGHVDKLLMEVNAILLGIKWLLEMQVRHVEIESDSLIVIRYLTGNDHLVSSLGHLVDVIRSLGASFTLISFKHVLRTGNRPAHHLAKLTAISSGGCFTWWQRPPPCIGHLLCTDNISVTRSRQNGSHI